jgi:hypothetical protein
MELERNARPLREPIFERGDDGPLFSFAVDSSSVVGPRAVTAQDRERYPEHWAAFLAENPDLAPDAEPKPAAHKKPAAKKA